MHFWGHLKTIHRHRKLVRKYCFRLGLYWQGAFRRVAVAAGESVRVEM